MFLCLFLSALLINWLGRGNGFFNSCGQGGDKKQRAHPQKREVVANIVAHSVVLVSSWFLAMDFVFLPSGLAGAKSHLLAKTMQPFSMAKISCATRWSCLVISSEASMTKKQISLRRMDRKVWKPEKISGSAWRCSFFSVPPYQ